MNQNILNGMIKAFFASAFADQADEAGTPLSGEIMSQLPDEMDGAAIAAGKRLYTAFERAFSDFHGDGDTLDGAYIWAHGVDAMSGDTEKEQAENFGHYAAMQAMGHGVGLWEYVPHQISDHVPDIEFSAFDLEKDYFKTGETCGF